MHRSKQKPNHEKKQASRCEVHKQGLEGLEHPGRFNSDGRSEIHSHAPILPIAEVRLLQIQWKATTTRLPSRTG